MATEIEEAELKREIASLRHLLGETRARYHQRRTPFASSEQLMEVDLEIRNALGAAPSQAEVRRLTARLRSLDPV